MDRTRGGSGAPPRGVGRGGAGSSKGRCAMNDLTIYDTLAESWWQAGSPLHLLARMNPPGFAYLDPLVRHWPDLHVLDVGCGGGLAAAWLVQRGARVVGLDLSWASLHIAARQTCRP